jgi:putative spermidine/putrescine transport system ATP-binding protein
MSIHAAHFHELRLDRLGRRFGSVAALNDISLTIRKGEFVALLGPSGCGKSTTLNCIAGLLSSTSGGIWLDDKRIERLRPEERGFGMVFQNYALFPHLSVRNNIGFGLVMQRVSKADIRRRVDEAISLVRLNGQEEKLPGQLSGGQQQRVAIARAIVIEPPLVLMDEPLSNLDAKLRLEMRAEMRRIHNSLGATTIYVTHDQEEALSLADRIVVLRDGAIRQIGTPEELFARPDHLDVADFMGFRNRLEGEVVSVVGDEAEVAVGSARLRGRMREVVRMGGRVVMTIRPDDLLAVAPSDRTLAAEVLSSEFRGRDHVGFAKGPAGRDLVFASARAMRPGETVHLDTESERALIFPGALQ